jgi:hypothetical protein
MHLGEDEASGGTGNRGSKAEKWSERAISLETFMTQ